MFSLRNPLECCIRYQGRKIRLYLSFDRVLAAFAAMQDDRFDEIDRIGLALDILTDGNRRVWRLPPGQKVELYLQIARERLAVSERKASGDQPQAKLVDFEADADLIYSGFMQAYGIDLLEQRGELDWRKFVSLFQGLPEDTRIREVMSIRGRELPVPTKYNQEEIRRLQQLKQYWYLPPDNVEDNYQEGLSRLFDTLERMAK